MGGRAVIGHQPLIAMRRRGKVPAFGVRLDVCCVDPTQARNWHRPTAANGMAVVWVQEGETPKPEELLFLAAMPVFVFVASYASREQVRAVVDAAVQAKPRELRVAILDDQNKPVQAWGVNDGAWLRLPLTEVQ